MCMHLMLVGRLSLWIKHIYARFKIKVFTEYIFHIYSHATLLLLYENRNRLLFIYIPLRTYSIYTGCLRLRASTHGAMGLTKLFLVPTSAPPVVHEGVAVDSLLERPFTIGPMPYIRKIKSFVYENFWFKQ